MSKSNIFVSEEGVIEIHPEWAGGVHVEVVWLEAPSFMRRMADGVLDPMTAPNMKERRWQRVTGPEKLTIGIHRLLERIKEADFLLERASSYMVAGESESQDDLLRGIDKWRGIRGRVTDR